MRKTWIILLGLLLVLSGCAEEVPDPVLTLRGNEKITIEYGNDFVEPGAVVENGPEDAEITRKGSVNKLISGEYNLLYETVIDGETYSATRKVVVSTPKNIEYYLQGNEYVIHILGDDYTDAGLYVSLLSLDVEITDNVEILVPGTYQINYNITIDEEVNTLTRTLIIVDPNVFSFFLIGEDSVTLNQDDNYTDLGYYISDPAVNVITNSSVDTSIVGSYSILYSITVNNQTTTLTRTVEVVSN